MENLYVNLNKFLSEKYNLEYFRSRFSLGFYNYINFPLKFTTFPYLLNFNC